MLESRLPDTPARARRIEELYAPSFLWVLGHAHRAPKRPLVVGLSAPQGSGKSTLVRELVVLLAQEGLRAVGLSIDDFYLRHVEQLGLAAAHPGNRALEHRGAPGTHDVALGERTLERLAALRADESTRIAAYDKTAHAGRGDRRDEGEWPAITGPLDVVVLEGWCLGFRPVHESALRDPSLAPVNAALRAYDRWQRRLDALMAWRARSLDDVVAWRVEAEDRSRAAGLPALDRAAATDYIRRFLPLYEAYQDTVTAPGPWGDRVLSFTLGADRLPVHTP